MEPDSGEVVVLHSPSPLSSSRSSIPKATRASISVSSASKNTNSSQSTNAVVVLDDSESEDDSIELSGDSIRKLKQPRYRSPRTTISYDLTNLSSEGPSHSRYRQAKAAHSSSDEVILIGETSGSGSGSVASKGSKRRMRTNGYAASASSSKKTRDAGKRRKYPTSSSSNQGTYGYAYPYPQQVHGFSSYSQGARLYSGQSSGYQYGAGTNINTNGSRASCSGGSGSNPYGYMDPYDLASAYAYSSRAMSQAAAPSYQYNARSLRGASKAKLRALLSSGRDFTAEDYETLLELDEGTKKKGLSLEQVNNACATTYLKTIPKDASCSICLSPFTKKQKIAILGKCMHKFHYRCSTRWLRQKNMCPICQQKVV